MPAVKSQDAKGVRISIKARVTIEVRKPVSFITHGESFSLGPIK